jgi:hypothetical protein
LSKLILLSSPSIEQRGISESTAPGKAIEVEPVSVDRPIGQVLEPLTVEGEQELSLAHLEHPVTAYLNGLAPSSRRPQLAALEAIARRSTQVFNAETSSRRTTSPPPPTACSQPDVMS